jgi:hypothetical protein
MSKGQIHTSRVVRLQSKLANIPVANKQQVFDAAWEELKRQVKLQEAKTVNSM